MALRPGRTGRTPGRSEKYLSAGKLPTGLLEKLLKKYSVTDPSVVVGPAIGIDSAIIDFPGEFLAAKSDPITFVAEDIGYYAVHVNANDIAVMGGTPRWFLATVLLPGGSATARMAESVFSQLRKACKDAGLSLSGGHTEITEGIDRPILVGHALGTVPRERVITAGGARQGDDIILTKGVAIEATSIIARALGDELKRTFPASFIKRCRDYIRRPGLSVVKDARVALSAGRVNSMHDPTEGGLVAGLHELSMAAGVRLVMERALIPVLPESRALSEYFRIDPLGSISSGALLLSSPPEDSMKINKALASEGIVSAIIGRVEGKGRGVRMIENGKSRALRLFDRDEITKILL
ncbi:MAG: AIR synthase family protein [Candidatus Methylomirabilis sp.]|nr:AIR synthase family protein [Deltaproteobacteria bacterium]